MKARTGELSLPVNSLLMILMMMMMITWIKTTQTLLTRSWSVQVIVVSQIVKAQISLNPAKSWLLQSVCSLIKHGMYKKVGSVNIPGSLFVRQEISSFVTTVQLLRNGNLWLSVVKLRIPFQSLASATGRKHHKDSLSMKIAMLIQKLTWKWEVVSMLSETHKKEREMRCQMLLKQLSLKYLLRQGLAIRGHDDNEGNLIQLLKLRGEDDPQLQMWLSESIACYC